MGLLIDGPNDITPTCPIGSTENAVACADMLAGNATTAVYDTDLICYSVPEGSEFGSLVVI